MSAGAAIAPTETVIPPNGVPSAASTIRVAGRVTSADSGNGAPDAFGHRPVLEADDLVLHQPQAAQSIDLGVRREARARPRGR